MNAPRPPSMCSEHAKVGNVVAHDMAMAHAVAVRLEAFVGLIELARDDDSGRGELAIDQLVAMVANMAMKLRERLRRVVLNMDTADIDMTTAEIENVLGEDDES
jgi:hypothetical protein